MLGFIAAVAVFITLLLFIALAALIARWSEDLIERRIQASLHDNDHEMIGGTPL